MVWYLSDIFDDKQEIIYHICFHGVSRSINLSKRTLTYTNESTSCLGVNHFVGASIAAVLLFELVFDGCELGLHGG